MGERILVVEDSPLQAKVLRRLLETSGFVADLATSAEEAIERVRRHRVALVLSDVVLPGADGFDLCRWIKRELGSSAPPLLLLTVLDETADVARGLECGADGYVGKPYDAEHLIGRIRALVAHEPSAPPMLAGDADQRHLLSLVADTLIDRSHEAFYVLDRGWRVLYVNDAAARLVQRSRKELLGQNLWEEFPEAVEAAYDAYDRAFREDRPVSFEMSYAPLEMWLEVEAYPRGELLVVHFRDVSRRKRAEAAVRESETRWRQLFEHSPLPTLIYDTESLRILAANEAAVAHYGYSHNELLEITLAELRPPEDVPLLRDTLTRTPASGVFRHASRHRTKGGRVIDVEVTGQGVEWHGHTARLVVVQDVTERTRVRQALEEASAAKSRFLSIMGHELRTPLAAIVGYADLLEGETSGPLTARQKEQVARVRQGAWHLNGIVEEVLSYARAEAHREVVRPESTDIAALAREVSEFVEPLASKKDLALRVHLPEQPFVVEADPGKLRQILINLLGNAIKFTVAGGVELELTAQGGGAVFRVSDTGPGVAPRDRERIFEVFEQGDGSRTRTVGGTGLGLAVSRRLARLMGGDVTLEGECEQGSTFTLRLPLAVPAAPG